MTAALPRLARVLRVSLVAAVVAFMFAPTIIMGLMSFSAERHLAFPPGEWGLTQYREALLGDRWLAPLGRSLTVAALAGTAALVAGGLGVFAIGRSRLRGSRALYVLAVSPLLVPSLAYAIALYIVFAQLHLLGTRTGLVLAHAVLGLPFVVLVASGALARVPRELEGAAMSLGATRRRALWDVTRRLLMPAFLAAFLLAFLTSFDEVVITSFVAGIGYETLPKAIFDDVREGIDPAITAVGMLLTGLTAVFLVLLGAVRSRIR